VVKPPTPTDTDRVDAKQVVLAGIARAEPLNDVFEQLRPYLDYAFPFPADLLVEIAADALTIAGATRATPVSLSDAARRYLPEWNIRGNTAHNKSRVAIELAVALHGGIVPDYDASALWWQVQDLAFYAFQATAIMIRIAAERTGRPVAAICGELAASHGLRL
jgi:hypothetical protein